MTDPRTSFLHRCGMLLIGAVLILGIGSPTAGADESPPAAEDGVVLEQSPEPEPTDVNSTAEVDAEAETDARTDTAQSPEPEADQSAGELKAEEDESSTVDSPAIPSTSVDQTETPDEETAFAPQAATASKLTATPAATNAAVNQPVNVNGTVSGFPGNVEIRTEVWVNNSRWSIHQRKTVTNGSYSMPLAYQANKAGTHKWRVVATNGATTVSSQEFSLTRVAPKVTAAPATTNAAVNQPVNVTGTVSGFAGSVEIRTEVWVNNSRWSIHQRKTVTNGSYSMPLAYQANKAGTHKWRVVATNGTTTIASAQFSLSRNLPKLTATPAATSAPLNAAVNVTGTVSGFGGPVELQTQVWVNNSRWSVHQRKTVTNGNYSMPLAYQANEAGTHKWRVVATSGPTTAVSNQFTVSRVAPRVTATPAAANAAVGAPVNVNGALSGFSGPVEVRTEVLVNGSRWSIHQRRTITSGSYSMPLAFQQNRAGTQTWRVVATDGIRTASSPSFKLTRSNKLDPRCLTGRAICASKKQRKMYWVIDGQIKMTFDARFGSASLPTREGAFKINWKSRNHVSSIYGTAMPYAMFFSGGQAVHYSAGFASHGYAGASAGCINVRDLALIQKLFDQAKVGDKVIVYSN